MKKAILLLAVLASGCSTITELIPSGWDVNQSRVITDLQYSTRHINCHEPLTPQFKSIDASIEWFHLYSTSKKTPYVDRLLDVYENTVKEIEARTNPSQLYCDLKVKILTEQIDTVAKTVQSRF